jgi:hypothetical protein
VDRFVEAQTQGYFFPRWIPQDFGGYGYPTFVFYQPAFFFLTRLFSSLPGYPLAALHVSLWVLLVAGGSGAYRLCRRISCDRPSATFLALFFLITPYLYVNLYVRGDLSEFMAMMLTPWPLAYLIDCRDAVNLRKPLTSSVLGMAISTGLVVISHPIVAMFLVALSAGFAFAIFHWDVASKKRFAQSVLMAGFLGASWTSFYWVPVLTMMPFVSISKATIGYFSAEQHVVKLSELFSNAWGFGRTPFFSGRGKTAMSLQLGLPHFLLAAGGLILGFRSRMIRFFAIAYGLLVLLMTSLATPLWEHVGLLRFVQFPWRILSVTGILHIACGAGLCARPAKARLLLGMAALLLSVFWYRQQFAVKTFPTELGAELETYKVLSLYSPDDYYSHTEEFLPVTAAGYKSLVPRGKTPLVEVAGGDAEPLPDSSDYRIRMKVKNPSGSPVTINQFYFPGWFVAVDGVRVSRSELEANVLADGRMSVPVPTGDHALEAYYEGPLGWELRNWLSAVAIALGMAWLWRDRRNLRRSNAPDLSPR